ncbi:MAG: hypothetical protein ACLFTE_07635 [Salinivenus sp.]
MDVRRLFYCFLGGLLIGLVPVGGLAQDSTLVLTDVGMHRDTIDTFQPQPYELRPLMVPGTETIRVGPTELDTSEYRLDPRRGRLWIHREDLVEAQDTLFAAYRTFPFEVNEVYRRRTPDTTTTDTGAVAVVEEDTARAPGFDPFQGVQVERSGSISRGVVGGTNRDVNVESGLRMQLDGEVAEDVRVRALLTDENTPLQPEGTTQRLRDFDRVFLELGTPQGTAQLGDVDVDLSGSTFGTFSRKVQGAAVESASIGPGLGLETGTVQAVGAVSRGQYRSQDIQPDDGVQGPYRLTGRNGESPVIVIAGSERVFLDGERLTRGETNDYVMDYARGELTFTSNRLITEDRRITVEFQYSETPFTRTFVGGQAEVGTWADEKGDSRVTLGATVLRQADGRDFQTAFDLSRKDSLSLVDSGDDRAVRSGASQVEFDPEAPYVQYKRTTVAGPGGEQDTAFVPLDQAPEEETPVYRVRFSRVGAGEGAYRRGGRDANGVVYEYVGPGEGRFAPVEPLPAPTQQRLVDMTGEVEPVPGLRVFGEWAHSLDDENRFSSLDAQNDRDQAYVAGLDVRPQPLDVGDARLGDVSGEVRRVVRGRYFETFGQTRPIEYARTWNLSESGSGLPTDLQERGTESVDRAALQVERESGSRIEGELGRLTIGSVFTGWRQEGSLRVQEEGWPRLRLRSEHVQSTNRPGEVEGRWTRQQALLRSPAFGGGLTPQLELEREGRRQQVLGTDSLTRDAFSFVELRPGLSYQQGALEAQTSVEYRTEEGGAKGAFRDESTSWTVESDVSYDPDAPYSVSGRGGLRRRDVTDYFRVNEGREDTESILLSLEGAAQPLDRAVQVESFYDASTTRTPVLQEVYIRTGPELGQYVWRDLNGDGVQQVDEFVPETTPNEGTYVRNFVPSDSLESVVDLQAQTRVTLRPDRVFEDASERWKRWLSEVSTRTSVEVQEKTRSDEIAQIYGLNLHRFRQPGLTLDGRVEVEQDVELLRSRRAYGLDLSWRQIRGLTERSAGAERTFQNRWDGTLRVRPGDGWGLRLQGRVETDRSRSEAFATRSFDIRSLQARPEVTYQPAPTLTLRLAGAWDRKDGRLQERQARVVKVPLEVEWTRAGRLRLNGTIEGAQVDLEGDARGLAEFRLTDGRGPGTSFLWGLQGRYVITNNLEATLNYDGRAPANTDAVHTLRAEVTASF